MYIQHYQLFKTHLTKFYCPTFFKKNFYLLQKRTFAILYKRNLSL